MTDQRGSVLQTVLMIAIFVAATVSLLSIWSDEWLDIPGQTLRMASSAAILALVGAYFWARKKGM